LIEQFFEAHQHTVDAIAAAGTLAAVATSLWLAYRARRADRTKLKATADLWTIVVPNDTPKFLQVTIRNVGKFPVRITASFFYWKVPFSRNWLSMGPLDLYGSPLIPRKNYPIKIDPRTTETFTLWDLATFKKEAKKIRETSSVQIRLRFIRAFVFTDEGAKSKVKLSPHVRQTFSEATVGEP
jgi:hypothetical protein